MVLEKTALEKDLGVWMDNKLKFTEHIDKAVAKSNQLLGLILEQLFNVMVLSSSVSILPWFDLILNMEM